MDTPAMPQDRQILEISGADRKSFLQGLISNDVGKLANGLVYAALLTPQGKYLADFLLFERGESIYLDVAASHADMLAKRLAMYKLRADVTIAASELQVNRGTPDMPAPEGAMQDPRHPALGWRHYDINLTPETNIDWDEIRVTHCIPETGIELTPDTYLLEAGFERLNGVDFRKGCYVGQEITARMKHKTELRKGLVVVDIEGSSPVGTDILADGKLAGTLFTQSGGRAIAHLRLDRAGGPLTAETAQIRYTPQ